MSKSARGVVQHAVGAALLAALAAAGCAGDSPGPGRDGGDTGRGDGGSIGDGDGGANGGGDGGGDGGHVFKGPLRFNEACASNEGNWVDEEGDPDDWIELVNVGEAAVELGDYAVSDKEDEAHPLPNLTLEPGQRLLLWSDDEPEQGPSHLPFKLSTGGETLFLWGPDSKLADRYELPEMGDNDSFARMPDGTGAAEVCRYATPTRENGTRCAPPVPTSRDQVQEYMEYTWPEPWPVAKGPVVINELGLRPAGFIELHNLGDTPVDLSTKTLLLSPHKPGQPWPSVLDGVAVDLPPTSLAPGAFVKVAVEASHVSALAADPLFEGVATLFDFADVVDRVDFMQWPEGVTLTRDPARPGYLRYCRDQTPGQANDACDPLASREVGRRLRHLRTAGDYAALAEGGAALQTESVKFIAERQSPGLVHLMSATWELHYSFVREVIEGLPRLDRCDPDQQLEYDTGWYAFSALQYFVTDARTYYLGTLQHYGGPDLHTVEFTAGDVIRGDMMVEAFFEVMRHVPDPSVFALRPLVSEQVQRMLEVDGEVPIVDTNAPFVGLEFQPLSQGVGYGTLRFIPGAELAEAALGPNVLVVTDDVPNDIPLVGGLITEAFQTPLAHVNVLSLGRGTPNMAVVDAHKHAKLTPWFDKLVRLEVSAGGFDVRAAEPAEAEAFWERFGTGGPLLVPRLDPTRRELVDLDKASLDDLPAIGAKAAQMAELLKIAATSTECGGALDTPAEPFAVPVVHSLEHYERSGARALLETLEADAGFRADPDKRARGLADVRAKILETRVSPELLETLEMAIWGRYGDGRTRLRSSSNTEDLSEFSGAGLYTSHSAVAFDDEDRVEDALLDVWASLYNLRAYDERRLGNVDEAQVAMAVLVHPSFPKERANGVAVSRNVLAPNRSDQYYVNAQIGEASVTNPAPGVGTDQIIYRFEREPKVSYESQSTLTDEPVLSEDELDRLTCHLKVVHNAFRVLLDPDEENRAFSIEVEFKVLGAERRLLFKQARPFRIGRADLPWLCL